jgi:hypothetical protein
MIAARLFAFFPMTRLDCIKSTPDWFVYLVASNIPPRSELGCGAAAFSARKRPELARFFVTVITQDSRAALSARRPPSFSSFSVAVVAHGSLPRTCCKLVAQFPIRQAQAVPNVITASFPIVARVGINEETKTVWCACIDFDRERAVLGGVPRSGCSDGIADDIPTEGTGK